MPNDVHTHVNVCRNLYHFLFPLPWSDVLPNDRRINTPDVCILHTPELPLNRFVDTFQLERTELNFPMIFINSFVYEELSAKRGKHESHVHVQMHSPVFIHIFLICWVIYQFWTCICNLWAPQSLSAPISPASRRHRYAVSFFFLSLSDVECRT